MLHIDWCDGCQETGSPKFKRLVKRSKLSKWLIVKSSLSLGAQKRSLALLTAKTNALKQHQKAALLYMRGLVALWSSQPPHSVEVMEAVSEGRTGLSARSCRVLFLCLRGFPQSVLVSLNIKTCILWWTCSRCPRPNALIKIWSGPWGAVPQKTMSQIQRISQYATFLSQQDQSGTSVSLFIHIK